MTIDVRAVQAALREQGLDGWLWYNFQGANPIAQRLAGLGKGGPIASRRWFYMIPATGEPRALVHAIERHNLDGLPGTKTPYAGRASARNRAEDAPGRDTPGGDGILTARGDSVRVARRRGYGRARAVPRGRGRLVGRPGPAVRGPLERRRHRLAQGGGRTAVSRQGPGIRGCGARACATASPRPSSICSK